MRRRIESEKGRSLGYPSRIWGSFGKAGDEAEGAENIPQRLKPDLFWQQLRHDRSRALTLLNLPSLSSYKVMSRNFYILAGALAFFALLSGAMTLVPSSFQPGLPANGSLWRMVALVMLLAALGCALIAVFSNLFEQVDRRSEHERIEGRRKRREAGKGEAGNKGPRKLGNGD